VPHSNIAGASFKTLAEGMSVEFDRAEGSEGPEAANDVKKLSGPAEVERLVADGTSRLTAERIVAIERGLAEPGRARRHVPSRH
jgi:hypothetical protein